MPSAHSSVPGSDVGTRAVIHIVAEPDARSDSLTSALADRLAQYDFISTSPAAFERMDEPSPSRLILFFAFSETCSRQSLKAARKLHPNSAIALLVDPVQLDDRTLAALVRANVVQGVLATNMRLLGLSNAIVLLARGHRHIPQGFAKKQASDSPESVAGVHETLTPREIEILHLMCDGTPNKVIAHVLKLSENTVKSHVQNLFRKLNVRNRTEASAHILNARGETKKPPAIPLDGTSA